MGATDFLTNPLGMMGNYEERKTGRDEIDGFIISTCWTTDEGFETAIIDKNKVHVVERYSNENEAGKGHEKWIRFIREGNRKVKTLGWSDTPELDEEVTLEEKKDGFQEGEQ